MSTSMGRVFHSVVFSAFVHSIINSRGTGDFFCQAFTQHHQQRPQAQHQKLPSRSMSAPRGMPSQLNFFNFGKPQQEEEPARQEETVVEEEPQDMVENIFSFFFGKPEEEPMGLKRFGQERFPEQYPAAVNEWADPVSSDDKDMATVRPLLKNTNLETRGLKLSFSAARNGWNAAAFHNAVDKKGGALVVCTTKGGLVCGGYNPKGWVSYGEARGSIAAFLFCRNKDTEAGWTKLRKVGGAGLAQMDYPETGPSFGADSLVIPLGSDNSRVARSKLGSYYERFPDGTNTLFGKEGSSVQLRDLKVYQGVYAPDEFIPHTDAEPFALY